MAKGAAIVAAYFGSAKLGLSLAFTVESVTAVWPPTGIALAALVLWGRRFWPAVALGALLANAGTGVPWFTVLGIATGNTLEALAGAWLLGRVGFSPSLERVKDVLGLAILAGGISTMASATIGVASLWAGGEVVSGDLASVWRTWWLGDMGGDLLVAPLLLILASRWPLARPDRRLVAEAALVAVLLTGTAIVVFSQDAPITYLAVPPLIWAALRFGHLGAAAGSLLVAGIAVAFTASDVGPFMSGDPDTSLLRSQTFMGVAGMTALVLAAASSERRRTEERLRGSYAMLDAVTQGVADAVFVKDSEGRYLMLNPAATGIVERPIEEALGQTDYELFPPETARQVRDLDRHIMATGRTESQEIVRTVGGVPRIYLSTKSPYKDERGRTIGVLGIARDITEAKREERTERFLAEASKLLAGSLDYEATLKRVARLAVPAVADVCVVQLVDETGTIAPVALAHVDRGKEVMLHELLRDYPPNPDVNQGTVKVIRTGEPELIPEVPDGLLREAAHDAEHLKKLRAVGLKSGMIVPLRARGRTFGAIGFASVEAGRRFDEQDLALAQEMASRCALAVDNARLYRERSHVAETLQESLLPPSLPEIPGFQVAARFRPAGEGNEVGGDFYDLFPTGEGGWALVMGDVCGKGPEAAAVTALARYTLRATTVHERRPGPVLELLNQALRIHTPEDRFCTVVYALLQPSASGGARLALASGGHPLPLLLRADGRVEPVGETGTLLGSFEEPRLPETTVELGPRDSLILYTDGVTEAGAPERIVGPEQLSEIVSACIGLSPDGTAAYIERSVLSGNGVPRDDIAILVLTAGLNGARKASQPVGSSASL